MPLKRSFIPNTVLDKRCNGHLNQLETVIPLLKTKYEETSKSSTNMYLESINGTLSKKMRNGTNSIIWIVT